MADTEDNNSPSTSAHTPYSSEILFALHSDITARWGEKFGPALENQRKTRIHTVDVPSVRADPTKALLEDETIFPDRTVNTNVRTAVMRLNRYLTEADNFIVFSNPVDDNADFTVRQNRVTRGLRFLNWKKQWVQFTDALALYGRAVMEVYYDPTMPLNAGYRYVDTHNFIMPAGTRDVQAAPMVIQRFPFTYLEFMRHAKLYNFDPKMVSDACGSDPSTKAKAMSETFCVDRCFFKTLNSSGEAEVYHFWMLKDKSTVFLAKPLPLSLGLVKFPPNTQYPDFADMSPDDPTVVQWPVVAGGVRRTPASYPFVVASRAWTENMEILLTEGIGEADAPVQEALTNIMSDAINGLHRASSFYPTIKPGTTDIPSAENNKLKRGCITPFALETFQPSPPPPQTLSFIQVFSSRNLQQAGSTDFAAMNRPDTEKTFRELALAKEQAEQLAEQDIAPFAEAVLHVGVMCWEIIRDQALIGAVKLDEPPASLMTPVIIEPAGDKEVLRRARLRQRMLDFWPIASGSPIAEAFFRDLVKIMFPEHAANWLTYSDALQTAQQQAMQLQQLIASFLQTIQNIPTDAINEPERSQLLELASAAQGLVQPPDNGQLPSQAPGGTNPPAGAS